MRYAVVEVCPRPGGGLLLEVLAHSRSHAECERWRRDGPPPRPGDPRVRLVIAAPGDGPLAGDDIDGRRARALAGVADAVVSAADAALRCSPQLEGPDGFGVDDTMGFRQVALDEGVDRREAAVEFLRERFRVHVMVERLE